MKKALSVLLVAAALFGFYGSAVTVNDLLACKDYWEEAGEKSTADMNKLEDGLNQLLENEEAYLDGVDAYADGMEQLADAEAAYEAGPAKLAAARAQLAAGYAAYNDGKKTYDAGMKQYKESKATLQNLENKLNELKAGFDQWKTLYTQSLTTAGTEAAGGDNTKLSCFSENNGTQAPGINKTTAQQQAVAVVQKIGGAIYPNTSEASGAMTDYAAYAAKFGVGKDNSAAMTELMTKVGTDLATQKAIVEAAGAAATDEQLTKLSNLSTLFTELSGLKDEMVYYGTLVGLVDNREVMKEQIVPLLKKMASDESVSKKLDAYGGIDGISQMLSDNGGLFIGVVEKLISVADDAVADGKAQLAAGKKQLDAGKKNLDAGKKKLNSGEAQYAEGLATYEAAPGMIADGKAQLAAGKEKLDQYEDGEQQVRDGLATLFNTEADLDLESIADRLNGDGDFDNGDNHLEIEEGLNAVEVGRGYQAEDGVLITNEIMGRAVATGGLLAAAVLAVIAAILSFLKKNKGAGVFAILAAAAGAFGAYYGPAQGTYFSEIAGSTIGATTWVAAGILGCVALVHAIAHFTAKKEA